MISGFNLIIISFSFMIIFTPTIYIQGSELNNQSNLKDTDSIVELARKCLNVARDEIKRGDLPIALVFVNYADQILAQANSDNIIENNKTSNIKINPNMCNWDDPESGKSYR